MTAPTTPSPLPKPDATLQASFALAGWQAVPLADGGWIVARWGQFVTLPNSAAAQQFLARISGGGRAA